MEIRSRAVVERKIAQIFVGPNHSAEADFEALFLPNGVLGAKQFRFKCVGIRLAVAHTAAQGE